MDTEHTDLMRTMWEKQQQQQLYMNQLHRNGLLSDSQYLQYASTEEDYAKYIVDRQRADAYVAGTSVDLYHKTQSELWRKAEADLKKQYGAKMEALDKLQKEYEQKQIHTAHMIVNREPAGLLHYDGSLRDLQAKTEEYGRRHQVDIVAEGDTGQGFIVGVYSHTQEEEKRKAAFQKEWICPKCGQMYEKSTIDGGPRKMDHICVCQACNAEVGYGDVLEVTEHICGKDDDSLWLDFWSKMAGFKNWEAERTHIFSQPKKRNGFLFELGVLNCFLAIVWAFCVPIFSPVFLWPLIACTIAGLFCVYKSRVIKDQPSHHFTLQQLQHMGHEEYKELREKLVNTLG